MMDRSRAIALLSESLRHSTDKRYIGFICVAPYAKADWGVGEARSCQVSEREEDELGGVYSRIWYNLGRCSLAECHRDENSPGLCGSV
jgi:hypothetical protein